MYRRCLQVHTIRSPPAGEIGHANVNLFLLFVFIVKAIVTCWLVLISMNAGRAWADCRVLFHNQHHWNERHSQLHIPPTKQATNQATGDTIFPCQSIHAINKNTFALEFRDDLFEPWRRQVDEKTSRHFLHTNLLCLHRKGTGVQDDCIFLQGTPDKDVISLLAPLSMCQCGCSQSTSMWSMLRALPTGSISTPTRRQQEVPERCKIAESSVVAISRSSGAPPSLLPTVHCILHRAACRLLQQRCRQNSSAGSTPGAPTTHSNGNAQISADLVNIIAMFMLISIITVAILALQLSIVSHQCTTLSFTVPTSTTSRVGLV